MTILSELTELIENEFPTRSQFKKSKLINKILKIANFKMDQKKKDVTRMGLYSWLRGHKERLQDPRAESLNPATLRYAKRMNELLVELRNLHLGPDLTGDEMGYGG